MKELSKEDQDIAYRHSKLMFDQGFNEALEEVKNILRNGRGADIAYKSWFFEEIEKLKR